MNSAKFSVQFYLRCIILVVLFTVASSVLYQPDTRNRAQLDADSSSSNQFNPLFAKFDTQVQYRDFESINWNLGKYFENNHEPTEMMNDQDVALNLTQTIVVPNANNSVCYEDLGCITPFSFYEPILWPINLLPEARSKIDTHFTLNTRDQIIRQPGVLIFANDTNGIIAASFKATRPTRIFVHGWLSTGYEEIFVTFVERLLDNGDFNVIAVHWGGGAQTIYNQAVVNIRLVGLEIAFLVNTLVEKLDVKVSDVHLIGHSLGAHASGYAGEKIPKLGRITGLDPAGWYFKGMPTFARLDPSDAQFVDAVHTDGEGVFAIGLLEPVGHVDFYPNGGVHQPGCLFYNLPPPKNVSDNYANDNPPCSHMRAVYLYMDSFLPDGCQNVGFKCPDFTSFEKGECTSCGSDNSQCAPFGLQASSYPVTQLNQEMNATKFYFVTGASPPYCKYHYAVNLNLAKPLLSAKPTISGLIKLSVSGQNGILSNVQLSALNLEYGSDYKFLLTTSTNLGPVKKVNLRWRFALADLLDVRCIFGICNQKLYIDSVTTSLMNNYPEKNIEANTYKTCPQFTPAVIGPFSNVNLSDDRCSLFNIFNYIWPWSNNKRLRVHD